MICAIARSDAAAQSQRPRHTHARRDPRLAKAGRSFIRGIAQHRPDRRALPAACFFGCRNLALIEQARDGADAVAFCGVKLVDPAHDTGLSLVDLIIGGRVIGLALVAIAKRSAGKHAHLALKGAMALPSPRPFQDLRAFIFGDHALKLQQQLVFRRRCPSRANEQDFDAGARELFDKKDLMRIARGSADRERRRARLGSALLRRGRAVVQVRGATSSRRYSRRLRSPIPPARRSSARARKRSARSSDWRSCSPPSVCPTTLWRKSRRSSSSPPVTSAPARAKRT
ncbi:hypothetical protein ABIF24_003853 [Bradyrhizobium elkanii]